MESSFLEKNPLSDPMEKNEHLWLKSKTLSKKFLSFQKRQKSWTLNQSRIFFVDCKLLIFFRIVGFYFSQYSRFSGVKNAILLRKYSYRNRSFPDPVISREFPRSSISIEVPLCCNSILPKKCKTQLFQLPKKIYVLKSSICKNLSFVPRVPITIVWNFWKMPQRLICVVIQT